MKKGIGISVFVCLLAAGAAIFAANYLKPGLTEDSSAAETTVPVTETTTAVTEPPAPFGYVHGEDGWYSLIDAGIAPTVRVQEGNTCWVNSAASAMESEHLRTTGKSITVDPYMLMDSVYRRFKSEGYFLKNENSALETGGSAWFLIQSMSNGYNGWILTDANDYDDIPVASLQDEIRKRGALYVHVPDRDLQKQRFGDYLTLNVPDAAEEDYDHAALLVGWADHFPKDYFDPPAAQDGAWMVQDSRSGSSPYYWISYETALPERYSFTLSGMHGTIASYDCGKKKTIQTGNETAVANVFHHAGTITGIGTYTSAHGQHLTVEIREGEFGTLLCAQNVDIPYKGYHTITLDTPQPVTDCTVIVRFDGEAPVEGGKWEDEVVEYRVGSEEGQSFVQVGSDWLDLSKTETQQALGLDFAPNNACIKAVFGN